LNISLLFGKFKIHVFPPIGFCCFIPVELWVKELLGKAD